MASTSREILGTQSGRPGETLNSEVSPAQLIPIPPSPLEVRHPRTHFRVQQSSAELQQFACDAKESLGDDLKFRMLYGDVNFLGTLNRFGEKGREMGDALLEKIGELAHKHFRKALKESHGGDEFDITLAYIDQAECEATIKSFFQEFNQYRLALFDQDPASRAIAQAADELAHLQRGMSLKITQCQRICQEQGIQFSLQEYAKFLGIAVIPQQSEADLMQRVGESALGQVKDQVAQQHPQHERRNLVGNFFLAQIEIPSDNFVQGFAAAKIQGDKLCSEAKRSERPEILKLVSLSPESDARQHAELASARDQFGTLGYDNLCSELACVEADRASEVKREMWQLAAVDPRLPGHVYRIEQLYDIPVAFFLGIKPESRVSVEVYDQARYGSTNKNLGHEVGDLMISFNVAVLEAEFENPNLFRMGGSSVLRLSAEAPQEISRLSKIADQMAQRAAADSKYYERYERAKADAAQRESLERYFVSTFPGYAGNEINYSPDFNPKSDIGTVRVEQQDVVIDADLTFGELWKLLNVGNITRSA